MKFNEFQDLAMETRLPSANEFYALLGLVGEVGEIYSLLAKRIRDGFDDEDDEIAFEAKLKKEIGDTLWFIAAICEDMDFTMDECAEVVIKKLQARKKAGTLQGSGDER